MRLTAPYAHGSGGWPNSGGPPTDFTADASGDGLQPAPDSSAWSNLLAVTSFKPPLVQGPYAIFSHVFQILPQNGNSASQGLSLNDLEFTLNDQPGTSLSLNVEDAFPVQSRSCCPTFTAALRATDGTVEPLPAWLSLAYGFVPDAIPILDSYQSLVTLDVGATLKLASYPGVQAVGNYTILVTATSADQPPAETTKNFTLRVRDGKAVTIEAASDSTGLKGSALHHLHSISFLRMVCIKLTAPSPGHPCFCRKPRMHCTRTLGKASLVMARF